MPTASSPVRTRITRVVVGVLAVLGLTLVLPGTAYADYSHDQEYGVLIRQQIGERSDGPLKVSGSQWLMQLDQRQMGFGERWAQALLAYPTGASLAGDDWCGRFVLDVTRYQAYSAQWESRDGRMSNRLLYRGGLVADYNRPYVGVFFVPGNRMEIRTFNYDSSGAVINAWTAASTAIPGNTLVLEHNGVSAFTGTGKKTQFLTGPANC